VPQEEEVSREMSEKMKTVAMAGGVGGRSQSELLWIEYCQSKRNRPPSSQMRYQPPPNNSHVASAPTAPVRVRHEAQVPTDRNRILAQRMGIQESRHFAIRQRDKDEQVHTSPEGKDFSDAYLGGRYEKPLLRSQMYDMLAEEQRRLEQERLLAVQESSQINSGPHMDDKDPHPLEGRVLNYPPPEWLAMHPLRPAVGPSPHLPHPWAFPIDGFPLYPEIPRSTDKKGSSEELKQQKRGNSNSWVKYF